MQAGRRSYGWSGGTPQSPIGTRASRPPKSAIKDKELLQLRRARLVAVATRLFMKRGFPAVSVNEIAKAAGMSIGALYKYVRSKDEILWLATDSLYGQLEDRLNSQLKLTSEPRVALLHALEVFIEAIDGIRDKLGWIYRDVCYLAAPKQKELLGVERRIVEMFADIITDGNQRGQFRCPQPFVAALTCVMIAHTWSLESWALPDVSLDTYVEAQKEAVLAMVGARPAQAEEPPK